MNLYTFIYYTFLNLSTSMQTIRYNLSGIILSSKYIASKTYQIIFTCILGVVIYVFLMTDTPEFF